MQGTSVPRNVIVDDVARIRAGEGEADAVADGVIVGEREEVQVGDADDEGVRVEEEEGVLVGDCDAVGEGVLDGDGVVELEGVGDEEGVAEGVVLGVFDMEGVCVEDIEAEAETEGVGDDVGGGLRYGSTPEGQANTGSETPGYPRWLPTNGTSSSCGISEP